MTADYCPCTGFSYRKTCKHVALVQALVPAMERWYGQAEALPLEPVVVPMSAGAPSGIKRPVMTTPPAITVLDAQAAAAEERLAQAYRALADAHEQSDERATLMCQVDELEREIAALHSQAIRYAA